MQLSNLVDVLSKLMQLKRITDWGLGAAAQPPKALGSGGQVPSRWAIFCNKKLFQCIRLHFARVQSHLKEVEF